MNFLFAKKNILFVLSSISSAFFGFVITILIARFFSKDVNANYQYYLTFFQVSSLLGWARADQFLTSVKFPPNFKTVIGYFIKNQYWNWIFVFIFFVIFIYFTNDNFINNYFYLVIILISGYIFGLINISNQYLIIENRYEYQGVFDLFQKFTFIISLFLASFFHVYLGLLMLISMLIRLGIFHLNFKFINEITDTSTLHVMIANGKRMFFANIFSNFSNFMIVFLISRIYSKVFYADYALVSILISFPASIVGQYIGLIIHRRHINGNKDFKILFKLIITSIIILVIFYAILPQFKYLIINLIGEKWSTIWSIYYLLWPLAIFTFLASILERTGYEFGSKLWPIFISFSRFFGILILFALSEFLNLPDFNIMNYFYFLISVLYLTYFVDVCRNMIKFYNHSKELKPII